VRPTYETEEQRGREQKVADFIAAKWKCSMHKLPVRYNLDYIAMRSEIGVAFCEIKSRRFTLDEMDRMGGYFLSLGKWAAARDLCVSAKLPFLLAVETADGLWSRLFTEFLPPPVILWGRKDRGDWQDMEPSVVLKCCDFKRIA